VGNSWGEPTESLAGFRHSQSMIELYRHELQVRHYAFRSVGDSQGSGEPNEY